MADLNICRICLRTEAKGYEYKLFQLQYYYEEVTAVKMNENDALPKWFCYECAAMLHKFHKFKEKCYMGQKLLMELLWKASITYDRIYSIESAKDLQSSLNIISVTSRVKTYTIIDDKPIEREEIEKTQIALEPQEKFEDSMNSIHIEDNNIVNRDVDRVSDNFESPKTVIIDGSHNLIELKEELTTEHKVRRNKIKQCQPFGDGWRITKLSEVEAISQFRSKAKDPKYLTAAHKCGNCFKEFSKSEMLKRHMMSRHSEELGPYMCRFCKIRFRWNCQLRSHLQQHYTRYECLKCHLVFQMESSALKHEEYHSGAVRTCNYCNEQFRHLTTYYSHLRTHRSAHVCVRCGASFVSAAGLRQHARRAHAFGDADEEDDLEPENSYCVRCNVRFETRKAYDEHLFHSALHTEDEKDVQNLSVSQSRKILGKKQQAKITKELRGIKSDVDKQPPEKRRKKVRRKVRKPTTCHQCGAAFASLSGCMRHHVTCHPRTSFYAPAQRYVCHLCGASLAPGSVAAHQNMHTREKVHSCHTCGRQFHSTVGLKRHMVTHTGEKPYACSLCDKRFTQSNSMKLHYRTFHLKQPYPKRHRKKKDLDQQNQTEREESMTEESDNTLEHLPTVAVPVTNVELPVGNGMERIEDEPMHYLTLS